MFQSPSLRGSGRFEERAQREAAAQKEVSIPFIAGQWSLLVPIKAFHIPGVLVSIPFIAGQWSLRVGEIVGLCDAFMFQSPSLRGSGRFSWTTS